MEKITQQDYQKATESVERIEYLLSLIDEFYQKEQEKFQSASEKREITALFIGGGSCSGKSTLRQDILGDYGSDFIIIDSDKLKEIIPEYSGLFVNYGFRTASIVHKESSQMAKFLVDKVIAECNNFLYDGTLKNTEKYEELFDLLREHNYIIHLHIVDCDIELAKKRNEARVVSENRVVPNDILEKSHREIVKSFLVLKDLVDEWYLYNTNGDSPILIANSLSDKRIENLYQAFLNKQSL
ncbi:zeta toxin family protein [Actinobacillus genomosp. 1]|uniref:zeta toxin family protein n=1 Tax=Actinobacillus genomosp. 1 TaxID=254839 RepID=UPI002441861C|nr:zeta toxin family protein [Actinobacillus genomosp. 1]WGE35718.1 zeta toxin family protein [Actinobacillus genomosp. 1]